MSSCCWRCLSSLYFACSALISGWSRWSACIDLNCLRVSGSRISRTTTVSPMIARPHEPPTTWSWMNTITESVASISGCRTLAKTTGMG